MLNQHLRFNRILNPRFGQIALLALLTSISFSEAQESGKTLIKPPDAAATGTDTNNRLIVREIEVIYLPEKSSSSVDRSVILSNMRTTVGQPYSLAAVEQDIKTLYATGLFTNLRIQDEPVADGVKVVVIVKPKSIVKEVIIIGNQAIKEKALHKKIASRPGEPLSEQLVSSDGQDIQDYYLEKGFDRAEVLYDIDINDQINRAVITYTIQEGGKAFVRAIEFEGNEAVTDKELRKVMKTRIKDWLTWINKSGRMKEDQFQEDLRAIRGLYQSKGYIDVTIEDYAIQRPEADAINITITLFEGIQYSVGDVKFQENQLFDDIKLNSVTNMKPGSIFSPEGLEADKNAIRDLYGRKGYIDTRIYINREPNIQNGKMDLVYVIEENSQSFVEKIIIQGNNQTKDKVLRRELALAPGDTYDSVRADASQKRLENLGYFSKVDVSAQETSVPNRKNMVVTVEEQRTGSVTFGAGFSTVDSLLGFVELTQSNFDIANAPKFLGAGQKFRMRLQYGIKRQDALISWTEPWFLNRRISLGFDGFFNQSDFLSSEFDQRRYGGAVRVGKALNQFWSVGMRYQFENIEIFDVDSSAPIGIQEEEGERTKSSVRGNITYDTRDSPLLARSGERVTLTAEGSGGPLQGDTDTWSLKLEGSKYFSLPYDMIFSVRGVAGLTDSFGDSDNVPLFDRFFIGGSRSIRGFENRSVGPNFIDSNGVLSDEPEGGKTMGYGNLELTIPVIDRVRFATFLDGGFNNRDSFDFDVSEYSLSTGLGLRLDLPIGPLRLDLGFPIVQRDPNDGDFEFHFDVGYQF
ncbi:MAG: outer membrane protein assembly factor BamA [Verrucomicrobiota bacterium]